MDMKEEYILEIDGSNDFKFHGKLLSKVSTSDNKAMGGIYSGETGRWTELYIYTTKGGKYVCHKIDVTRWDGERDSYYGKICENESEVKEYFGYGNLAKEIYDDVGIDYTMTVD